MILSVIVCKLQLHAAEKYYSVPFYAILDEKGGVVMQGKYKPETLKNHFLKLR